MASKDDQKPNTVALREDDTVTKLIHQIIDPSQHKQVQALCDMHYIRTVADCRRLSEEDYQEAGFTIGVKYRFLRYFAGSATAKKMDVVNPGTNVTNIGRSVTISSGNTLKRSPEIHTFTTGGGGMRVTNVIHPGAHGATITNCDTEINFPKDISEEQTRVLKRLSEMLKSSSLSDA
jgi:hypothetical protein